MLLFIGDIHNDVETMNANLRRLDRKDDFIIQVGDYSLHPYKTITAPSQDIWFMDGNHDYMPDLTSLTGPVKVAKNLTYIPRGTVLVLEGRRVGFLGGGDSLDKNQRVPGWSWFPEESINNTQAYTLLENAKKHGGLDLLVTHVPPATLVSRLFGITNISPCSHMVEEVWNSLGRPLVVCGHMHKTKIAPEKGGIVLGIHEIIGLESVPNKAWKITKLHTHEEIVHDMPVDHQTRLL